MARASVRASASIALVAVFALGAGAGGTTASASDPAGPAADLEGVPIPLLDVGLWHCHDLDWPRIHCFRSQDALDRAVQAGATAAPAPTSLTRSGPDGGVAGARTDTFSSMDPS